MILCRMRVHQVELKHTRNEEFPMSWGSSSSVSLKRRNIGKFSLSTLTVVFYTRVRLAELYYDVLPHIKCWKSNKNLYWAALISCLLFLHSPAVCSRLLLLWNSVLVLRNVLDIHVKFKHNSRRKSCNLSWL